MISKVERHFGHVVACLYVYVGNYMYKQKRTYTSMTAALACSIFSLMCCLILCFLVRGTRCRCCLFFLLCCFLGFTSPVNEWKICKKQEKRREGEVSHHIDPRFGYQPDLEQDILFFSIFTIWLWCITSLSFTENGGCRGLQRKELKSALRFVFAAHLITACHLFLVHFFLHLLEKIRHLHLFVVPQPMALFRHKQNSYCKKKKQLNYDVLDIAEW